MQFHGKFAVVMSGVLSFMLMVGCTGQEQTPSSNDDTPQKVAQTEWETQVYEDEYLRYEIPASWAKNEDYSLSDMRLAFFTEKDPATEKASNVNIQVLSLENQSKDMDYSDPKIQKEYHEFLLSPEGLTQKEAQDGDYNAEQIEGVWVYSLSFDRDAGDGTMVRQTAYFPMGLDYAIVLWATDFQDDCTPSVEEVAKHMCATLELLQ